MPLRFWRRVKVAPGVTINLSKGGASVSVGPRGARTTFGRGRVRQTLGLPGTGMFYTRTLDGPPAQPVASAVEATTPTARAAPVPWRATLVIMVVLTAIVIAVQPNSAPAFALVGTPIALVLAWLLRRHPAALGRLIGVAIVAVIALAVEVIIAVLAAALSGGKSGRRRRR